MSRPWLLGSLVVMLVTGMALFLSESVKCYYNQAFWVKITTLPVALLFTLTVRQRVRDGERRDTTTRRRDSSRSCRWRCGSRSPPPDAGSGSRRSCR